MDIISLKSGFFNIGLKCSLKSTNPSDFLVTDCGTKGNQPARLALVSMEYVLKPLNSLLCRSYKNLHVEDVF